LPTSKPATLLGAKPSAVRKRDVVFSPEAQADLIGLYDYIAESSGSARAIAYIGRIEAYCRGFELVGERGTRRDDIRPGLRIVGFERRVTIAFHVDGTRVVINRIFYGGRDIGRAR
jgi:toxin ParE1/3/4